MALALAAYLPQQFRAAKPTGSFDGLPKFTFLILRDAVFGIVGISKTYPTETFFSVLPAAGNPAENVAVGGSSGHQEPGGGVRVVDPAGDAGTLIDVDPVMLEWRCALCSRNSQNAVGGIKDGSGLLPE